MRKQLWFHADFKSLKHVLYLGLVKVCRFRPFNRSLLYCTVKVDCPCMWMGIVKIVMISIPNQYFGTFEVIIPNFMLKKKKILFLVTLKASIWCRKLGILVQCSFHNNTGIQIVSNCQHHEKLLSVLFL